MMGSRDALIIATGTYEDPELRRLRAPAQDAEALTRVLTDPAIGGFHVEAVVDQPARVITRAAQRFFADRGLDDLLLVHLSCHGVKDDDGRLYFAALDTEKELLAATGISAGFMVDLMEHCRARSIVLLLDCCYSGAFIPGAKGDEGVHLREKFEGEGRAILTASNAIEYSWEGDDLSGEGAPSVFTSAVVEGLETGEADRDRDGMVSIDDLYQHVYDRVRAERRGQTPKKWEFGIEYDLYLAKNPRPIEVRAATLPTEMAAALESPLASVRAGIVEDLARLLRSNDPGIVLSAQHALEDLLDDDSRRVAEAAKTVMDSQVPIEGTPDEPEREKLEPEAWEDQEPEAWEDQEREAWEDQEREAQQSRDLGKDEPRRLVGRPALIAGVAVVLSLAGLVGWLASRGPDTTVEAGPTDEPSITSSADPPDPSLLQGSVVYVQDGDVRALNPKTGENRLVAEGVASAFPPSISPDGAHVLFGGAGFGGAIDVFLVAADGSGLTNLTKDPHTDDSPDWSPDGSRILFESDRNGDFKIFVMDADGSNVKALTNHLGDDQRPDWSPDGNQVAFQRSSGGRPDVFVMDADGSNVVQLTDDVGDDGAPIWSPNGQKILFRSNRTGEYGIWVMAPDGSDERAVIVTDHQGNIRAPAWSPDGTKVVFASDHGGADFNLYVVDAEGGAARQLTDESGDERAPTW